VIEFLSFCDTLGRYVVASDTSTRTCRYFRVFATRFGNMSLATTCWRLSKLMRKAQNRCSQLEGLLNEIPAL
jgi:hypothetical protein